MEDQRKKTSDNNDDNEAKKKIIADQIRKECLYLKQKGTAIINELKKHPNRKNYLQVGNLFIYEDTNTILNKCTEEVKYAEKYILNQ